MLQIMLIAAAWIKFPEGYRQAAWAMTVVLLVGLAWLLAIYLRWGPHAISKVAPSPLSSLLPVSHSLPYSGHYPDCVIASCAPSRRGEGTLLPHSSHFFP